MKPLLDLLMEESQLAKILDVIKGEISITHDYEFYDGKAEDIEDRLIDIRKEIRVYFDRLREI